MQQIAVQSASPQTMKTTKTKSGSQRKTKKEKKALLPYQQPGRIEAGCDEAGRGCLAGPVYAAAVVLPDNIDEILANDRLLIERGELNLYDSLVALNDSKQLTEAQRYRLRPVIEAQARAWAVAYCDNHEIDQANILRCSIESMHRAVRKLQTNEANTELRGGEQIRPEKLLIDGNRFYSFEDIPYETIVKGDGKMMSIAAASVLAKTYRDDFMVEASKQYPAYNWAVNKGYPTADHRDAIAQHGATPLHRMTFRLLPEKDGQLTLF